MQIPLTLFPLKMVHGIYSVQGEDGRLPDRMRMLETGMCADSFATMAPHVVVSDMFRTAEASLAAMQKKRGVQPPSYSHHNYGRAIDLDVDQTLKMMRAQEMTTGDYPDGQDVAPENFTGDHVPVKDKRTLDFWLAERGWYCFRGDHKTGRSKAHPNDESWHYDFLGDLVHHYRPRYSYVNERRTAWAACQSKYAAHWLARLKILAEGPSAGLEYYGTAMDCQTMLFTRGFYNGAIDGKIGPQTREAIGALQRAWKLPETMKLDAKTVQVLVYVCAQRVIVPYETAVAADMSVN